MRLLERCRRDDLAGGGLGAQGAGLGGNGQGVVAVAVGDDGVLIRRLVEDAGRRRYAILPDQPDLVDLIRFQRGEIAHIEDQEVVLRQIGDLAAGLGGRVRGGQGDRLRNRGGGLICSRKRRFQTSNPAESRSRMAAAAAQGVALDQKDAGFRIGSGTGGAGAMVGTGSGAGDAEGAGGAGAGDAASAAIAAAMRSRRAGGGSIGSIVLGRLSTASHSSAISAWHSAHVARCARTVAASSASTAPRANAPSRSRVAACLATVWLGSTIELRRTGHTGRRFRQKT